MDDGRWRHPVDPSSQLRKCKFNNTISRPIFSRIYPSPLEWNFYDFFWQEKHERHKPHGSKGRTRFMTRPSWPQVLPNFAMLKFMEFVFFFFFWAAHCTQRGCRLDRTADEMMADCGHAHARSNSSMTMSARVEAQLPISTNCRPPSMTDRRLALAQSNSWKAHKKRSASISDNAGKTRCLIPAALNKKKTLNTVCTMARLLTLLRNPALIK